MARSLVDPATGAPLAVSALVTSGSPPPLEMPHLVVSTPAALVSFLDNVGPSFGYEWTRAGVRRGGLGSRWKARLAGLVAAHLTALRRLQKS